MQKIIKKFPILLVKIKHGVMYLKYEDPFHVNTDPATDLESRSSIVVVIFAYSINLAFLISDEKNQKLCIVNLRIRFMLTRIRRRI